MAERPLLLFPTQAVDRHWSKSAIRANRLRGQVCPGSRNNKGRIAW
jgi:hypothetical protein